MMAKGGGRIVNNASIVGEIGHPDIWYGITKAGMINMTKNFAKILGPGGVVINAVAAGPVETEMLHVIPEQRKKTLKELCIQGDLPILRKWQLPFIGWRQNARNTSMGTCIDINDGAFPR
jgi:3-oxoacyl-[acyl-carrier protein] reductase